MKSALATLVAFSSLLVLPITAVHAAPDVCTWTGTTNNLWSVGTNWSGCDNGGVPEAGDSLIFPAAASNLSMNNDQGALIYQSVTVTGPGYTFGGNDIIVSDTWQFASANNTVAANIGFTNTASATLAVSGGANVINGNIILNLTAGADMNLQVDADINHNGAITGVTDGFQEIGTSTWITSAATASTFTTTNLNIASGAFQCRNNNCFGNNANPVANNTLGAIQFNNAVLAVANNITLNSTTSPQFNAMTGTALTLSGNLVVNSNATLLLQSNTSVTVVGTSTLNTNAIILGSAYNSSLFEFQGAVSGAGGITADAVEVILFTNNTYTGTTTILPGALVSAVAVNSLGSTIGGTVVQSGGTLAFESAVVQTIAAEPLTLNGSGIDATYNGALVSRGSNSRTLQGNITLGSSSTISGDDVGIHITRFEGAFAGTGDLTFVGGACVFVMQGTLANSYVGTTIVNSTTLALNRTPGTLVIPGNIIANGTTANRNGTVSGFVDEQISDTSVVTLNNLLPNSAGVLSTGGIETIGELSGNGTITSATPTSNLRIGNNNTSTTFSGLVVGPGTIEKIGTGTLTLTGNQSIAPHAMMVVSGGRMVMNGLFGLATSFAVNSGATLSGAGTASNMTVNTGGILSPGDGVGCLNITGTLTLASGANFDQELAGATPCSGYDQTTVTGAVNLNNATLNVVPTFTPNVGDVFTIIQAGSISGQFVGLADGAQVTISGLNFRINYTGTTVTLTYISGTLLAPTGQNTNQIALVSFGMLILAAIGLGAEYGTRRRKLNGQAKK